jgi:hypothetical protein
MAKDRVLVRRYKDEKEYQKDANKMAKQGYVVDSVVTENLGRGGCRWLAFGLFNFLSKPKHVLVVTYRLAEAGASKA